MFDKGRVVIVPAPLSKTVISICKALRYTGSILRYIELSEHWIGISFEMAFIYIYIYSICKYINIARYHMQKIFTFILYYIYICSFFQGSLHLFKKWIFIYINIYGYVSNWKTFLISLNKCYNIKRWSDFRKNEYIYIYTNWNIFFMISLYIHECFCVYFVETYFLKNPFYKTICTYFCWNLCMCMYIYIYQYFNERLTSWTKEKNLFCNCSTAGIVWSTTRKRLFTVFQWHSQETKQETVVR